jgi:hypothetical protein
MCASAREASPYKLEAVARACTIPAHFADNQKSLGL